VYEVEVDELGPSLRNATAKVNKTTRGGRRLRRRWRRWRLRRPAGEDPWATPAPSGGGNAGGWGAPAGGHDDPPF
jgi:single-strand DNA-binding protein